MKRSIIQSVLIAAALLLSTNLSLAAESKSATPGEPKAAATDAKKADAKKAAPKAKPVDINSGSKAELMKLPGIKEAEADKIIAARPFPTKSRLVTNGILTQDAYNAIAKLIVAANPQKALEKEKSGSKPR